MRSTNSQLGGIEVLLLLGVCFNVILHTFRPAVVAERPTRKSQRAIPSPTVPARQVSQSVAIV